MTKRGRPRSSWQALKKRGAKRSVWTRRKREGEVNPAAITWLEAVQMEDETYSTRCILGSSVCHEFNGRVFDWRPEHDLTTVRNLAQEIVNDPNYAYPETIAQCAEFLEDLNTGASRNIYVDPEAVANLALFIKAFGPTTPVYWLTFFDLVRFFAQRTATGGYVLDDAELLGFDDPIIKMLDQACLARR
jgi:hypothetical protein